MGLVATKGATAVAREPKPASVTRSSADAESKSLRRGLDILSALAFGQSMGGLRLMDIVRHTGLPRSTVHRLLRVLIDTGFVEYIPGAHLYFLGYQFLATGSRVLNQRDLQMFAGPSLQRLAELTGDTVYLLVRSGNDSVALDIVEGEYPVKTLVFNVGMRRVLGKGAGPVLLLAGLPDEEIEDFILRNQDRLHEYPRVEAAQLWEEIHKARRDGCAVNMGGIVQSMNSVAVPVMNPKGKVVAALSITAIAERMEPERRTQLITWMKREAARIQQRLSGDLPPALGGNRRNVLP